jgi:hypothetical protein
MLWWTLLKLKSGYSGMRRRAAEKLGESKDRPNTVGKLCLNFASLIWRNANDPRESLPMPGMRQTST